MLDKAGPAPRVRRQLYDFIVHEFKALEKIHPHRIEAIRVALQNQKHLLLAFTDVLDAHFQHIVAEHKVPLKAVWQMCELLRCQIGSDRYAIRSLPLDDLLGDTFDAVEEAVMAALNATERTSFMVENLHSRLKPYLVVRKNSNQNFLDLMRFYFNHTPFLRSEKEARRGKTPADILLNKPHHHWLEMLDLPKFKRAA